MHLVEILGWWDVAVSYVMRMVDGSPGFVHNVGWAMSVMAELWVVLIELELVWSLGVTRLMVEMDFEVPHNLIAGSSRPNPLTGRLVKEIPSTMGREWEVFVLHCYQEANSCVDWMAW
ncbi:hypothetical protein CRG98_030719 [Punica granatum]|uniref:RNase H type-1 domain-containing protein n=1 Tax=Punica granatum TaxID=22663 RepID=A0A2I0IY10_PUNGR|nr:hypothetical protein CRG98_030719 [Punica granatum]